MTRTAVTRQSSVLAIEPSETRAVSQTLAEIRAAARKLNLIANRMDRTLAKRLRRLDELRA